MHKSSQYISQHYDRIRILGKGSFGTATVHRRRADHALVVLKEIEINKFRGERERLSAIQEAQIMSTLNHENIIKFYAAYTTESKLIIEMEYAGVGTLQAYLANYKNHNHCQQLQQQQQEPLLDEPEILIIFRHIASGLNYLHSKNIVHSDLKMANIFVTLDGLVKIGDFGISKFMSTDHESVANGGSLSKDERASAGTNIKSNSHLMIGTLAYNSPERCMGELADFKSDIWSLGCILYELITSRQLFVGDSLPELVLKITRISFQPIERKTVTRPLVALFEQMISADPRDRPSANDLVSAADQLWLESRFNGSERAATGNKHHHSRANHSSHNNNRHSSNRFELSTEAAFKAAAAASPLSSRYNMSQITLPRSLVYQVRLSTHHISVDRVNLPPTKRIREMCRGKSHYLVLTHDNIVYGWGSKNCGQLGACSLTSSLLGNTFHAANRATTAIGNSRFSQSARNSVNMGNDHLPSSAHSTIELINHPSTSHNSLATSEKTIIAASTNISSSSLTQQTRCVNHRGTPPALPPPPTTRQLLSKQLIMTMLEKSQPASRPFVINELNNRKIVQIGAGHNFSVFLSKTGIVMTCGLGVHGCLGRGDLASCFMPRMVDSLLNRDVVSIACGPKHVIAVCGNGRVFAWGRLAHGRLGIVLDEDEEETEHLQREDEQQGEEAPASGWEQARRDSHRITEQFDEAICCSDTKASFASNVNHEGPPLARQRRQQRAPINNKILISNHVVLPQQVQFPNNVFIKSVHCGRRSTIFIDSNNCCWACGENKFNKLGLDIKRRFKQTIIVEECWQPCEISALSKYKIVSCNIGENHSSFITNEGKVIIFGQDIDHSYRLKSNIIESRASYRRISFDLKNAKRRTKQQNTSDSCEPDHINTLNRSSPCHKILIKSMLLHDQLFTAKIDRKSCLNIIEKERYPLFKATRSQRQQIDTYVRKSRASKKMPFDYVVSASCTSKFTLALTNCNRVYFWGTRSYDLGESCLCSVLAQPCRSSLNPNFVIEPQLVAHSSDQEDNFIKIGQTNSTLMNCIQMLGSDQPIIYAQDPRLAAKSLADLWILDYEPPSPMSSRSSSESSLTSHGNGDSSSSCCPCHIRENERDGPSCTDSLQNDYHSNRNWCTKNDAILEPQPIVSLYVPSMFNQSGSALHLANMYCFDEDRFYLILDTTVKLQQSSSSRSKVGPSQNQLVHKEPKTIVDNSREAMSKQIKEHARPIKATSATQHAQVKLASVPITRGGNAKAVVDDSHTVIRCINAICDIREESFPSLHAVPQTDITKPCFADRNESHVSEASPQETLEDKFYEAATVPLINVDDDQVSCATLISPMNHSSQFGVSMDEPRSCSTFAATFGHIIVGAAASSNEEEDEQSMQALNFEQSSKVLRKRPISRIRRRHSSAESKSESTTMTGDDTSSMPTWVKNEYNQNQNLMAGDQLFAIDSLGIEEDSEEIPVLANSREFKDDGLPVNISATSSNSRSGPSSVRSSVNAINIKTTTDDITKMFNSQDLVTNRNDCNTPSRYPHQMEDFCYGASLPSEKSIISVGGTLKKSIIAQALSQSQPDISDLHRSCDSARDERRASIDAKVMVDNRKNLLDCRVYRAGHHGNDNHIERSNLNSEMSSRCGSIHPLLRSIGTSLKDIQDQLRQESIAHLEKTPADLMNSSNHCHGEANITSCKVGKLIGCSLSPESSPSPPSEKADLRDEVIRVGAPTHSLSHTNVAGIRLNGSGAQPGFRQRNCLKDTKAGSCSSLNSLRRSLIKLFC